MRYLLLCAALALAACGSASPVTGFYKAEAGYTVVLQAAANYVALPRCVTSGPTVCSDQKIVDQIRKAANAADATVQSAEDVIRNNPTVDATFATQAAQSAIQALTLIMQNYKIGGV